jgi:hypothetical protein
MDSYYREIAQELLNNQTQSLICPKYVPYSTGPETMFMSEENLVETIAKPIIPSAEDIATSTELLPDPSFSSQITKSYTSFSGCDMVISFGAEVCGEVAAISYYETTKVMAEMVAKHSIYCDKDMVKKYPNVVAVRLTVFNNEKLADDKEVDITITYANEHGMRAIKSIVGCVPLFRIGGTSIDSVVTESIIIYAARKIFPMEEAT